MLEDAATVFNTLDRIQVIVKDTLEDTRQIAQVLKGRTLQETCKNVFDFLYNHIQYKLDKDGVEQLRRPARSWADRRSGIDCDCYSIFASSILTNLGISHSLRIIELKNKGYYQHIYVVVPDGSGNYRPGTRSGYFTIDPVLDKFNTEAPGITKISDRIMKVQYLNGLGNGSEYKSVGLAGLGNLSSTSQVEEEFYGWLGSTLESWKNTIKTVPGLVDPLYDEAGLLGAIEYTAANIHDESTYGTIAGFDGQFDTELLGLIDSELFGEEYSLGKTKTGKKPAVFTKIATAAKAVKQTAKEVAQKATSKEAVKKVADIAKAGAKNVVKYSPITAAARAGFLLAMETNLFQIANQVRWAYANDAQIQAAGVSAADRSKAKEALAKIEKLFVTDLQGKPENLKKAILSGKQKLSGAFEGFGYATDFEGLGEPVTAATGTAAAMAWILKAKDIIKGLNIIPKAKQAAEIIKNNPKAQELIKKAVNNFADKKGLNPGAKPAAPSPEEKKAPLPPPEPEAPSAPAAPYEPPVDNSYTQNALVPVVDTSDVYQVVEQEDMPAPEDKPKEKKSSTGLLIFLGVAAVGAAALMSSRNSGRKTSNKGLGKVSSRNKKAKKAPAKAKKSTTKKYHL